MSYCHPLSEHMRLIRAVGYEKQLPARKAQDIMQVLQMCPDLEFIVSTHEKTERKRTNH